MIRLSDRLVISSAHNRRIKMKPVFKVVGTHALINGAMVAGLTVIIDMYKLYYNQEKK